MGIQVLYNLKLIHKAGYVYNDLMIRNIIVDSDSLKLIDFGNSMEFLDFKDQHYPNITQKKFRGNLIIASQSVMNFGRPSRKDDMISLCYLLLSFSDFFDIVKEDTSHMT